MICTARSNVPNLETQSSCPTIVSYCLIWSQSQNSGRSFSGWFPAISGVLVFPGLLPNIFSYDSRIFQHIMMDLQQGIHHHLWYIHIEDAN